MEFRVLGPLEVLADGVVLPVRAPRQRSVLAALLLCANQVLTVDRLVDLVWGDAPPPSAVANLRTHVSALRGRLAQVEKDGPRLVARSGGYLMTVEPGELDLSAFQDLVAAGRQAAARGENAVAAGRFREALALWRGNPVENVVLFGAAEADVARLAETRLAVLEDCFRARLAIGDHVDVAGELRGLVLQHPLREELWALLMLALHAAARQADALAAYEQARRRLAEELGIDPGGRLRDLRQRILTGEPIDVTGDPIEAQAPPRSDLPRDIGDFTGREAEFNQLLAAAGEPPAGNGTAVVISAIDGMAGIGKTTLAVHLAHHLAQQYRDGQLFLDLRGHAEGHDPLTPAAALERLLRAVGVPGDQIPQHVEDRVALWRATLAGRRALIVLDNAADSGQVRPLLPGTRGCLVLITSRRRLTHLDGAALLSLDVLSHADAVALFETVVGDSRPAAEPDKVAEVVAMCAHLPLAIRVAAARLRHRPSWTVAHLAGRLREDQRRLSELQGEDGGVAAVFALSYQYLGADHKRVFRLLGLHPGPDIESRAAAALAGLPARRTESLLEDLVDAHLLQQRTAGRYRLHDLLRAYAGQVVADTDSGADRRAALTRLFDHYLHTASVAIDLIHPAEKRPRPTPPAPDGPSPDFRDHAQAFSWLEIERPNLLAVAAHAAENGWPDHTGDLSITLVRYLNINAHHDDALALHTLALTVARRGDDEIGQGHALNHLGITYCALGRFGEALDRHRRALAIFDQSGDGTAQSATHNRLGAVYWWLGQFDEALDHHRRALTIFNRSGDRLGQGVTHDHLGLLYWRLGRFEEALDHYRQALAIHQETGHLLGQSRALNGFGHVYGRLGRFDEALDHYRRSLAIARETGHHFGESRALIGFGHVYERMERFDEAIDHYRQALTIARKTGHRSLELMTLNLLGDSIRLSKEAIEAIPHHELALGIARDLGDRYEQAHAHSSLGHGYADLGQHAEARDHWRRALTIYVDLGATAQADETRRLLA